ncbi:head processing protein [Klebsiella michiganensis]
MTMQSLRTVTDRFSLVDKIRKHTPQNNRRYLIERVRQTINSPMVREHMALGEMFGYYGHGRRAMYYEKTKSLMLPEMMVVMVDGKPVTLENVPAARTVDISIDDSGIVSHTQDILTTDQGQIVSGMCNSNAGGWSWATSGPDTGLVSLVNSFCGFDYVALPNFISLDKQTLMMESVDDRQAAMHKSLSDQGFNENAIADIIQHYDSMTNHQAMYEAVERTAGLESALMLRDIEIEQLKEKLSKEHSMMESAGEKAKLCRQILREAIHEMPVFISKEQRQALCRMESEGDAKLVAMMLESLASSATRDLPVSSAQKMDLTNTANIAKNPDKSMQRLIFVNG